MTRQSVADYGPSGPLSPVSVADLPPGAGPAHAPAGPTPAGIVNALKRRWRLAATLGGLAAALAAAAVWGVMPAGKHTARALVQLRAAGPDVVSRSQDEFEAFRKGQMFQLKARDLINRTLADPAIAALETVRTADDPVRLLEDGLKVDAALAPDILTVTLSGDHPADLTAIVDGLVKRYAEDAAAQVRRDRDERRRELDRLAEGFKAEVLARDRQIRVTTEANGVLGPEAAEAKHARMQGELAKIEGELFAAQRELRDAEDLLALLVQRARDKKFEFAPAELAAVTDTHPRVAPLVRRRADRAAALTRARDVAGTDRVPIVADLIAEVKGLDAELATARAAVRKEIEAELGTAAERALAARSADARDRVEAGRRAYDSRLKWRDEYQKVLTNSSRGAYDIQALQEEVKPYKEYLAKVQGQLVQLDAEKEVRPRAAVREGAVALLNRNLKQKAMTAAAAGLAGFVAVLVLVGFLEWRARRVDGPGQLVAEAGMRVLGAIPAFPPGGRPRPGDEPGWRLALNEAVNSTRTMLLHSARSQAMQVVMVTSATQGEGKTSLAGQLGASMAGSGMRTVIVDCDLRNPSVHAVFGLGAAAGVGEVVCQEADAADVVQPTAIPNLWVIPAGKCSPRVVAALAQGHPLETLFNRLRGQFDFILVDSCPVLPVADALLVGQHVDGVVFAVMQDVSQLPKIIQASDRLAQLNIPLLGAVVNGTRAGEGYHTDRYHLAKPLPA